MTSTTSTTSTTSATAANLSAIEEAIESRHSVRAFTAQGVDKAVIAQILQVASRAPSGTNCQPWRVYVVQGACRDALVEKVCTIHDAMRSDAALVAKYTEEYDYYPQKWVSPYIDRRRENGWGLYGLLGIGKGDKDKMHAQAQRNFRFFDAPVALICTVDKVMGRGSLLDYGMFLENIMLAARGHGLHTCAQAAWNPFASVVLPHIGAGANEMLVCCIALGYADESAIVNAFHTPREGLEVFTQWLE